MKIPSRDIPQADNLEDVIRVLDAVNTGRTSFQDIAAYIGKVERQGRYYRRAAEILGLIKRDRFERNTSRITQFGIDYLTAAGQIKNEMIVEAILNTKLFQRIVAFLENHTTGITENALGNYITLITEPTGPSMVPRRVNTILNWLTSCNIIREVNGLYFLQNLQNQRITIPQFDINEPLFPQTGELNEYREVANRASTANGYINYMRDQIRVERAYQAHNNLLNLVVRRIKNHGLVPRNNQLIDLATRNIDQAFIFEIKSLTTNNARAQIRKGVSQLYEYRYLQNISTAKLILVIEQSLPSEVNWMHNYLESDREIYLVWDGNNDLYASDNTKGILPFLW